jgi:hypothetical protein
VPGRSGKPERFSSLVDGLREDNTGDDFTVLPDALALLLGRPFHRAFRYTGFMIFDALPGHDLIEQGVADLAVRTETVPALLVAIGAPRLKRIGISVPDHLIPQPEIALYLKLQESDPDSAHSRYNSLIRTLVSFERAAECAA